MHLLRVVFHQSSFTVDVFAIDDVINKGETFMNYFVIQSVLEAIDNNCIAILQEENQK